MPGATLHGASHRGIVPTPTPVGQLGIPRRRRHSPRREPQPARGYEPAIRDWEDIMRTTHLSIALALAAAAWGCHPTPDVAVNPVADTLGLAERARQDSIAQADAEARARAEAERAAAQRVADSVAALQTTRQMQKILTTMIHFDYDRSVIRPGDAQVLDLKIPVLEANADVRIQVAGNCDERGSDEYNL